jgi:hypothetical protein
VAAVVAGGPAPTVAGVIALLVGIALGVALNAGPLAPLGGPLRWAASQLIDAAVTATSLLHDPLSGTVGADVADVVAAAVAVAAPGLVCLSLVALARATSGVRATAVAVMTVAAVAAAVTTGPGAGLVLFVLAAVLAVGGAVVAVAVGVVAGVMAASTGAVVLAAMSDTARFDDLASSLAGDGFSQPVGWLLVAVAVAPLIGSATMALRPAGHRDGCGSAAQD